MNTGCQRAGVFVAALLLSGCIMRPPRPPSDEPPPPPPVAAMPKGEAGGVFTTQMPWTLVTDSRAFRPGDVLTVVLQETTQARKSADTSIGKQSSIAIDPVVVGGDALDSDFSVSGQRKFAGTTTSTQQNALQGAITVIVQEVLPNGLLRVHGEKSLYLNQGEEFVRVAGYVRAQDIDSANRVSSQRIANARIAYSGRGPLNDANSPGWLTRFFTSPWMPF
ncbi:MAG TPA: flagellar basal body L-ring protein FlgH [Povalibacter sp.]|uniref:flagellar basal body L-ring protein FlgH n=1 Tax=Povalibacter sp. TaxID=1962978 RepID=UPI002B6F4AF0|nr:flagellar basal body L-ring protein FlgH [Povalibacter sp.]HMN43133.1 flagellar basal body L-ring protein FlgH [Povalibacter sp.]